jgi:hypothetical protein
MVAHIHPDLHLLLVTGLTLLLAWGPLVAAVVAGIIWGPALFRDRARK